MARRVGTYLHRIIGTQNKSTIDPEVGLLIEVTTFPFSDSYRTRLENGWSYIPPAIFTNFLRLPERVLAADDVFSAADDLVALTTQLGSGHRHQERCHRHRHSGMLILSPTSGHSSTTLGSLIWVPDLFRHRVISDIGLSEYRKSSCQIL